MLWNEVAEDLFKKGCVVDGKLWVGLGGIPGSGKSTAVERICRRINELNLENEEGYFAVVMPMDGFHLRKSVINEKDNAEYLMSRRGAPFTFDPLGCLEKIREIKRDNCGFVPDFNHGVGDPDEDAIEIKKEHKIVILEGLYMLLDDGYWKEITNEMDEIVYINCSLELCKERLLKRHMEKCKYKSERYLNLSISYNNTGNISKEDAETRVNRNDLINAKHILSNLMNDKITFEIEAK